MYLGTVIAAFQGQVEVVWATVGYYCGFNSDEFSTKTQTCMIRDATLELHVRRCKKVNKVIWKALEENVKSGDIVAKVTAGYLYDLCPTGYDKAFMEDLVDFVNDRNATLLMLGDSPVIPKYGSQCSTPETAKLCEQPRNQAMRKSRLERIAFFTEFAPTHKNTYYFSANELFCNNTVCGAYVPGTSALAYMDYDHWTSEGSLYVAPFLNCFLVSHNLI